MCRAVAVMIIEQRETVQKEIWFPNDDHLPACLPDDWREELQVTLLSDIDLCNKEEDELHRNFSWSQGSR